MRTNRILRVLMVSPLFPPDYAGGGAQALELSKNLCRKRVKVMGLSGTSRLGPSGIYLTRVGSIHIYRVYRKEDAGIIRRMEYILRFFAMLFKLSLHSDIIHFHGIRHYPILGIPIALVLGKKTVGKISLVGTDDPLSLRKGVIGWIRSVLYRKLDKWIALTKETYESCRLAGVPLQKVTIIPNGVRCDLFKPIDLGEKDKVIRSLGLEGYLLVVFAGIISYRKGVDLLAKVIPSLLTKYPNVSFVLVGPASIKENPQVDEDIVETLRQLDSHRVIVTGFVDNPKNIIRSSDIFVLPSRKEGLSNAFLEAMSSGLPVIIASHPWLNDVGKDGVHFVSFRMGDPEDLQAKIEVLIESRELRNKLSSQARTRIEEEFCIEVVVDKYEQLYRELSS